MWLLNWLFPPRCVQCQILGDWICKSCKEKFENSFNPEVQITTLPNLDQVFIACKDTSYTLARLLYAWKYRLWYGPSNLLQSFLTEAFCVTFGTTENIICVPIPVHTQKLRDRGFNQAKVLLNYLQTVSTIQVADLIIRQKNTRSQVGLTKLERQKNLQNAFVINTKTFKSELLTHRIILIDDILTSGTTMQECAQVLRTAGFKRIDALVLHRGTK